MKKTEIIELGTKLGLPFNEETNFPDLLAKDYVVFDGCNGQRFGIDGKKSDDEIYEELGKALILYGKRQLKLELHRLISITGD
jgi:hypothetical protein